MDHFAAVKDKFINDVSHEESQVVSHSSLFYLGRGGRNLHVGADITQCVSKTNSREQ